MAWRDSRASRRKLLFFSCSIVLGIAALTAVGSLGSNLERAIENKPKACSARTSSSVRASRSARRKTNCSARSAASNPARCP